MAVNHRIFRLVFAFGIGLLVAFGSYRWITDADRGSRKIVEESVVLQSQQILRGYFPDTPVLHLSDPLDRVREAGKVYIFPTDSGWEISGHYQRDGEKRWHAFLMTLDTSASLVNLAVEDDDPALLEKAKSDPRISVYD